MRSKSKGRFPVDDRIGAARAMLDQLETISGLRHRAVAARYKGNGWIRSAHEKVPDYQIEKEQKMPCEALNFNVAR